MVPSPFFNVGCLHSTGLQADAAQCLARVELGQHLFRRLPGVLAAIAEYTAPCYLTRQIGNRRLFRGLGKDA